MDSAVLPLTQQASAGSLAVVVKAVVVKKRDDSKEAARWQWHWYCRQQVGEVGGRSLLAAEVNSVDRMSAGEADNYRQ
jgi:hypothetical protein